MPRPRRPRPVEWFDFWYQNPSKIDSLFSQLNGRLDGERKEILSKGVGGTGELGVELGGLLARLGLAKGNAKGELRGDYERILEVTSSLSRDNKVVVLLHTLSHERQLHNVDLVSQDPDAVAAGIARTPFAVLAGGFT